VLPQPDGPSRVKNSFSRMETETLSRAATLPSPVPKTLLTPRTSIAFLSGRSGTQTPHCLQPLLWQALVPWLMSPHGTGLGNHRTPIQKASLMPGSHLVGNLAAADGCDRPDLMQ